MIFIDGHCDILYRIKSPDELISNSFHWDAKRALSNGSFIQVLSLFANGSNESETRKMMELQLRMATKAEELFPDTFKSLKTKSCMGQFIESSNQKNQVGYLIEAEGSEIIGASIENLDRLYSDGLRILTLCWNYDNRVCDSIAGQGTNNGISDFGFEVVKRAENLGIIIDVSHSSDKTFDDLVEVSSKPFIASHSNSRYICPHRRNLTDQQAISIAKSGGYIGINLCPDFLNSTGNPDLMDIIRHIEHFSALIGTNYIGLGCDFDGIDRLPNGIRGVEDMSKIINQLLKLNYSEDSVKGIAGLNIYRVMSSLVCFS